MVLKIRCPGCGYTLRFVDEQAGQLIRCFNCKTESTLPAQLAYADTDERTDKSSPPLAIADAWYVRNAAGEQYGPVPKSQIVEWVNEKRIDDTFQVRQAEGQWQASSQFLGAFRRNATRNRAGQWGQEHPQPDVENTTEEAFTAADDYLKPHHGEVVLALAVLGLFCCGCGLPLSLTATTWGAIQMRNIQDGSVDPSGKRMLLAGTLLGLIPCIVIGLYLTYLLLLNVVG
ncbi:MAG: hypothetical protein VX346_02345 [Planctomycetota bacterium]|nr:hypothetical protein [Planctomycetota bacterium]